MEVEWQLDALDLRPVERWLAAGPRVLPGEGSGSPAEVTAVERPVRRLVDIYLDTGDWRIARAGYVLRIRHHAEQAEVTLKGTAPAVVGLRKRTEVSEPLPVAGVHAMGGAGPVGRRLRALAGSASLVHLLEVRTRRRPYQLYVDEETVGEIDLDDTIIVVGDDQYPVRMRRVEVEVGEAWVERLSPLVEQLRLQCGLQPAILSKLEAGLLAAGLHVPALPDVGSTVLAPEPSLGDVAFVVLRRNVTAMLAHEPGTRLGEEAEELHDMRVATRRLRAALDLFEPALPGRSRRLRQELGWVAQQLGLVRDFDVQLARLNTWRDELPAQDGAALGDLAGLLHRQRDEARGDLLGCLDSERYDTLVSELISMLHQGPGAGTGRAADRAGEPAVAVVPTLVLARHRAATKAARRARRTGDPTDVHRLRILCKRLRYALEFVSEIYDGRTRGVVRRVVALQDCLGLMQDAGVATGRLRSLATTVGAELSPATVFAMGELAERYRREAEHVGDTLPELLVTLKGRQWRKLKALMERRRLEVGPRGTWPPAHSPPATADPAVGGGTGVGHGPGSGARAGSPGRGPDQPSDASTTRPAEDPVISSPEGDAGWDEDYPPALRAVPAAPPAPVRDVARSPLARDTPGASPHFVDTASPRRRKDPVFLATPPRSGHPTESGSAPDPPEHGDQAPAPENPRRDGHP
jgi:CHAD domain-containing protein